ncbi:MAG: transcriptional regulator [Segetibacter sp.]|nr:transcriptional regulator [Segetibacter sp.]
MRNFEENPLHVMLADDDPDDCFLFNEALELCPTPVRFSKVEDGNQLIKYLEGNPAPDILFLDVNMPYKNGIECLMEIRANQSIKELPVIIYSTTNYKGNIDACFAAGASCYVVKPNTFDDIIKMVRKFCNKDFTAQLDLLSADKFILQSFE